MVRRIRWQIGATLVCASLILLLLAHLALATTAGGEAGVGGVYREALVGEVNDLNPLRGSAQTRAEADLSGLLFEGLTRVEATGVVVPDLAENWQVSSNNLVYTMTLRNDVRWHDATPFSANDVIWTIDWIKSPQFNGDPSLKLAWQNIAVTALNPQTVRFNLPVAFAPFLNQLTVPMLPSHLLRNATPEQWQAWNQQPIGTGSFRFGQRDGNLIELVANADYRPNIPNSRPNLERLEFRLYPTMEAAHEALRRDTVDAFTYDVTEQGELPLPVGYRRVRAPLADYVVLTINLRRPPLDDLRVRQAIDYAVDPNSLIADVLQNRALPLTSPILPSSWAVADELTGYIDDPEQSRANGLLDQAGWQRDEQGWRRKAGQLLRFELVSANSPERSAIAERIQAQLATVGVSTSLQLVPSSNLQDTLSQHTFDLAIHGWSNLGSDPDVYELWHSSQVNAANFAGLEDPAIDDLLVRARQTTNQETRRELYAEFQAKWLALAPSVMLYQPLLEQQVAPSIEVLGLAPINQQAEVLYRYSDRFRRIANWYQVTTRQVLPNFRNEPQNERPR
ncbi:peptide ABC transporter substrate-binding protein [Herpetosiphon geysericola]|uniref:peptide ABC transporter substrate-binding protein n=1 Tax=Herpetosiphon geysericola TaxID=70996 RepID=UPI0006C8FC8C|nr:peptide ABC transporter substrate-binding protein [Herpetosiphon geysericola]